MTRLSPYALGASLYMPATRPDLLAVATGKRLPELRSLVICLEDAVAPEDLDRARSHLRQLLDDLTLMRADTLRPLLFIRPRDARMAKELRQWPGIERIDGWVLPKCGPSSLSCWAVALDHSDHAVMPVLETREVFDAQAMAAFGRGLRDAFGERVLALRIGGNDLLACLGLRRPLAATLYETPLGYTISMLATVLGGQGFSLTAPVFERLDAPRLLAAELARDLAHGLVGKTAIHPLQLPVIHQALRIPAADLASARRILAPDAPAVFRHAQSMCEPATHRRWAERVIARAGWHGVDDSLPIDSPVDPDPHGKSLSLQGARPWL